MFVTIFPLVLISKLVKLPRTWLLSMPFAFSESSFLLHSRGQTLRNWSCSWCYSCPANKPKCFSAGSRRARTGGRRPRCPEHSFSGDPDSQVPTCTSSALEVNTTFSAAPEALHLLHPCSGHGRHYCCPWNWSKGLGSKEELYKSLTMITEFLPNFIIPQIRNLMIWIWRVIRSMYC